MDRMSPQEDKRTYTRHVSETRIFNFYISFPYKVSNESSFSPVCNINHIYYKLSRNLDDLSFNFDFSKKIVQR